LCYARGRHSFDDVRKKSDGRLTNKLLFGLLFDDKKLDWEVDKNPLKKSFSFFSVGLFGFFDGTFDFGFVLMPTILFSTGGYAVRQE